MVSEDITRVLKVIAVGVIIAIFLGVEFSFKIGTMYGLMGAAALVGLWILSNHPDLTLPFLFIMAPLWYMVNGEDWELGGGVVTLILGLFLAVIVLREGE